MNGISPQLQNQITQFQQVQQQLQAITTQKVQMDAQRRELVRTREELEKSTGTVYRTAGSLLIKVDDVDALKAELDDSIEMMEVRISSLERQETSLKEKYTVLQQTISAAMGGASAPSNEDEERSRSTNPLHLLHPLPRRLPTVNNRMPLGSP